MRAPPTRADLIAGSGDHRYGSRGRRGRTRVHLSSWPVVWVPVDAPAVRR